MLKIPIMRASPRRILPTHWAIISAVLLAAGFFGFEAPALIVCAIFVGARSRRPALALGFLAVPLGVLLTLGILAWNSLRPRFQGMGLPGTASFNLDRNTRCYQTTGGCMGNGCEWLKEWPQNFGLSLMCATFGPPPHTYHGPYPTNEEIQSLINNAPLIPLDEFLDGKMTIQGRQIELGKQTVDRLFSDLGILFPDSPVTGSRTEVRAGIFQESCLVIGARASGNPAVGLPETEGVYLFELKGLKPFARFVFKGHAYRIPWLLTSRP
jgi:hypothetical protein